MNARFGCGDPSGVADDPMTFPSVDIVGDDGVTTCCPDTEVTVSAGDRGDPFDGAELLLVVLLFIGADRVDAEETAGVAARPPLPLMRD